MKAKRNAGLVSTAIADGAITTDKISAASSLYVSFHYVRGDGSSGVSALVVTGIGALDTVEKIQAAQDAIRASNPGIAVVTPLAAWPLKA